MNGQPLSYADFLPLAWAPADAPLTPHEVEALSNANQEVLAMVAAIENHRKPPDDEATLDNELARLHQKVDLLLELVSAMAHAQLPQPPPVAVRISSQDMVCQGFGAQPGPGIVSIYLHRCMAQPLRLPAQLDTQHGDGSARMQFLPLDESCTAALERHVFLHHRRSVAEARLSQKR
ncbi:MAG TPA: PilZ domain-containing protein [Nevskiaceae bacterium]|nr:PilZ domain-containing protein [Nevskiaceae bacterium]